MDKYQKINKRQWGKRMNQRDKKIQNKYLLFRIGQEKFGIDIMAVKEIEEKNHFEEMAISPYCKGVMCLGDGKVPIYSLNHKLNPKGVEKEGAKKQRIITRSKDLLLALEVDEVLGVEEIAERDIYNTPSLLKTKSTRYLKLLANIEDELILLLDENNIIDEQEYEDIKNAIKKG